MQNGLYQIRINSTYVTHPVRQQNYRAGFPYSSPEWGTRQVLFVHFHLEVLLPESYGCGKKRRKSGEEKVRIRISHRNPPSPKPMPTPPPPQPHRFSQSSRSKSRRGRGGTGLLLEGAFGACDGFRSNSMLSRLLPPLALVWTRSKLLVLERRLVNSVKLSRWALEADTRFSPAGRGGPSSDDVLPAEGTGTSDLSLGIMYGWLCVRWLTVGRTLECAV